MKALVYEGPRDMKIKEMPTPTCKENEVLIRVMKVGICGSELSGFLGKNSLRVAPLVMGHEFSGIVIQVGKKVKGITAHDRVTVNPLLTCGRCQHCMGGQANLCEERLLMGAHLPGAFAEYVVVPEENVYLLSHNVSYDYGAITEPFACAIHIARLAQLTPQDKLLIMGAGPIGLLVFQTAKIFGLENIVIYDINKERVDIACRLGAVTISSEQDLEKVKPLNGFDVTVDAVGVDKTRQQCISSIRRGGRVILSGLHNEDTSLPINIVVRNEIHFSGAFAYNIDDFEQAIKWVSEGKLDMSGCIEIVPLEKGKEGFEHLIHNPKNIVKILLEV